MCQTNALLKEGKDWIYETNAYSGLGKDRMCQTKTLPEEGKDWLCETNAYQG